MEHQPERMCECKCVSYSKEVTMTEREKRPLHLIKGVFESEASFPVSLCCHTSRLASPPLLTPASPPSISPLSLSLPRYLASFLFVWLVACQHPIITFSIFPRPPSSCSLFSSCLRGTGQGTFHRALIPNQLVLYMSVRQWPHCTHTPHPSLFSYPRGS